MWFASILRNSLYQIFECYLLHDKWHLYFPVGLRSYPLVVRFMRFISGTSPVYPFRVR